MITAMVPPGGAGIGMHVIPVEKAIETENQIAGHRAYLPLAEKVRGQVCGGALFLPDVPRGHGRGLRRRP